MQQAPISQGFVRPRGRNFGLELLEVFLQKVRPYTAQVVAQQVTESNPLYVSQILRALERAPTGFSSAAVRSHRGPTGELRMRGPLFGTALIGR